MAPLYNTVKIGNVHFPVLPKSGPGAAYGGGGLTPADKSWMQPPKQRPRVVPVLQPWSPLPFESPKWQEPHQSGPKMVAPTIGSFLKRGLPRQIQPLVQAASWAAEFMDPPNFPWAELPIPPTETLHAPDGDYHFQYTGMVDCGFIGSYAPGNPGDFSNTIWQMHGSSPGHGNTDDYSCFSSIIPNTSVVPGMSPLPTPPDRYVSMYTRLFSTADNDWHWYPYASLYKSWRMIDNNGVPDFTYLGKTPTGELPIGFKPLPLVQDNPALRNYNPGATSPGVPTGLFPPPIPFAIVPKLLDVPGIRERSSPATGGGTNMPIPINPRRPKPGEPEKKKQWKGKPLLKALREGVFHPAGEGCDAVKAIWETLPGSRKWVPGQPQGCLEQAIAIGKHWREIDVPQAILNLALNHYSDQAIGTILGAGEAAFKKASGGIPGWRTNTGSGPKVTF